MMLYRQTDPEWAGLALGNSSYHMGAPGSSYGCLTVANAIAFTFKGWKTTPKDLCTIAGLYINGDWYWAAVSKFFPQYHFRTDKNGEFVFLQVIGTWRKLDGSIYRGYHWLLKHDGVFYDPLDGTVGMKSNYVLTGYGHSADIDQAPAEAVIIPVVAVETPPKAEPQQVTVQTQMLKYRRDSKATSAAVGEYPRGTVLHYVGTKQGDVMVPGGSNVWLILDNDYVVYSDLTSYRNQTTNV